MKHLLVETKKKCNVIYCQSENENVNVTQHGKLLRFFWSSHLRSSIKKVFLKASKNSQYNTCVEVSILINLHASGLQPYQKRDSDTGVFLWIQRIFKDAFFQNTSERLLLNITNENKASENEISNRWFYLIWSFIYKSYCIITNIRRSANKFIKPC